MKQSIALLWKSGPVTGKVKVLHGSVSSVRVRTPGGSAKENRFRASRTQGNLRVEVTVQGNSVKEGSNATLVTVQNSRQTVSFFLRDVTRQCPIFIPDAGIAITPALDGRTYDQVEAAIRSRCLQTELDRFETQPEETFANAAANTRKLRGQTWLGLSRDYRIFAVGFIDEGTDAGYQWSTEVWNWIEPRFHYAPITLPENDNKPVRYQFIVGRGMGCTHTLSRRLDEGCLPIVRGLLVDGHIHYHITEYVTLENQPLTQQNLRGTHYLAASPGMVTPEQKAQYESLVSQERDQDEQTVIYGRVDAVNTSAAPAYAWFKAPAPSGGATTVNAQGYFTFTSSQHVYAICTLNGRPLTQGEIAVLVPPGQTVSFEFRLPHRPIPLQRAKRLARESYAARLDECRNYWKAKLASAAGISVPEPRIDEMARAGLLHLDLITFGREPSDTVAPTIGVYSPIGSESAPIILFYESMGWHDLARRSIMYFFDKQHPDGFMQNFGGYMLETGCVLWLAGEHYRYTRDLRWVRTILPGLLKACAQQAAWRDRNKRAELRGKGYGLIEGKVGDPEDPFRQYMLNGYAAAGMARAAELLKLARRPEASRYAREAAEWTRDIRQAMEASLARGPAIPLGDGTWNPTTAPWADETHGPLSLYAEPGNWYTHGAFQPRDSLSGPLWLSYLGILEQTELMTTWLLRFHSRLMCERNVAFCQPYYSRHTEVHLARGEVNAFLKTYYNCMAAYADRETYTFWEHYFHASPHKTHEEAWFLMQTRWMLWREEGDTLKLLSGIPRAWMQSGKRIAVQNGGSHFGPVSFTVESSLDKGRVEATIACPSPRRPANVWIRLPHPERRAATKVEGGTYDAASETVVIKPFRGKTHIRAWY